MPRQKLYKESSKIDTTIVLEKKVASWVIKTKSNLAGWLRDFINKEYKKDQKCNIKK
jgi:hypothetical protein